jgi:hypothetical protein
MEKAEDEESRPNSTTAVIVVFENFMLLPFLYDLHTGVGCMI